MAKLGAHAPRTRYINRIASETGSDSGVVRTLCSFLTASGFERELEIPVMIDNGRVIDPGFAMIAGRPTVLSKQFIQAMSDAGTVLERLKPGHLYSTAYVGNPQLYRELCEAIPERPKLIRPIY
jgi:hypothetical protein